MHCEGTAPKKNIETTCVDRLPATANPNFVAASFATNLFAWLF